MARMEASMKRMEASVDETRVGDLEQKVLGIRQWLEHILDRLGSQVGVQPRPPHTQYAPFPQLHDSSWVAWVPRLAFSPALPTRSRHQPQQLHHSFGLHNALGDAGIHIRLIRSVVLK